MNVRTKDNWQQQVFHSFICNLQLETIEFLQAFAVLLGCLWSLLLILEGFSGVRLRLQLSLLSSNEG